MQRKNDCACRAWRSTSAWDGCAASRKSHRRISTRRPDGAELELIVVHGISLPPGAFGGPWIDRLFTNTLTADEHPYFAEVKALRVSSHLLIRRDGGDHSST